MDMIDVAITFERIEEAREIVLGGDRWGVALYINEGWSVYRATETGLEFAGYLKQLGREALLPLIESELAEEVWRRG